MAQEQKQQYATFDELSRKLDESEKKFAQRWTEGNPIFLLRIIRGTTARLYETELKLPQGSVQFELGNTPNLEQLNLEVFNRIFGRILSNLGQLLELKPEIVRQIGGVDIFYEPAKYSEFLSAAAAVQIPGVISTNSTTSSIPSTPSNSSASSLPSNSGLTPLPTETPIPINEVDGLRFVLQSLPGEIKVKLGGEENYLPLANYYPQLVNIARKLQQLKPKQLERIAPLNLNGLSTDEDIAQALEIYEDEVIDVEVISSEVISSEKIPIEIIHPEEEENPRTNSTELTRFRTICGPDITRELVAVLEKVQNTFHSWGGERKAEACRRLYIPESENNPASGRKAWDILELYRENHEIWIRQYQPICSTEVQTRLLNCAISVKVAGQCYYAGSVNYVVFGKMCKLCQDEAFTQALRFQLSLDDVTVTEGLFAFNPISVWLAVFLYKGKIPSVRKNAADNYEWSQKWAAAGYSGWPSGGSTPESDRPTCWPVCSIPYSHGPFHVQWGMERF